ncbi:SusC/RagA family TonB-linked outer membrane protein [Flavisolibacter ginsengisoli]|jgi:TonB-linked SusC/RagA family outer membrane protein|uniref:TonB-linked outer membrane protein, SusC/RagA family n=1 Tax=Flavisolibacter ginsengisoli DSM 18119 TaxID=1121884 RepID=A0A1M5EE09_9BACT|nr:SusC/RagA family TonB-linked outer membrane protein [Flavisolibacter ginsengisoli]SHF77469.1 TonB-linked outer membrane protein, SusC/RagA family [Flavisolibacter ginsengisoli DSM 18119]
MKKTLLSAWILLFISMPFWALSQSRQITGIVSDEKGVPLSGASVLQKGTTNGTSTDERGSYTLTVTGVSPVLVFSFAGRQSQEMAVGTGNIYNVSLGSSGAMSEVIVTALGIRKEKRSLGYTVQSVNAEDLTVNHQSNVVNALQGKVAGVTISSTGGAPGQGARIQIRGINSLDAGRNNQPIFIVDGVEVDNSTFTTGGGDTRGMTNRAADINPDDIESISVLRGGAATALYGIRAANGAVLITTKSARAGKIQVSYTGSYGFDNVNKTPDVQTKFTQGYLGVYDNTSFWPSWGPTVAEGKAQDPTHPDQIFNNFKRAYRQGNQTRHSINLGGGSEMMQLGASFSYSNQNGVIPFSDYKSYNARVNGNLNVSKKLKIGASMNFINSGGSRVNSDRYGEQLIYWSPRWDVMDYIKPDGTQKNYGPDNDNPVYTLATNRFFDNVNRVIASTNVNYAPTSWLNFTYRFGNDFYTDGRTHYAPGPKGVVDELVNSDNDMGFYEEHTIRNRIITSTFIANVNHNIGNDFSIDLKLGHDLKDAKLRRVSTTGDTLVVPDLFLLQNTKKILASNLLEDYRNYGIFGDLTLGFRNYLFLEVTGRNDFTSTLSKDTRSYFYPSYSLSYIFSDMLHLPTWFSYGKLKASYAKVGKDGNPYGTTTGFVPGNPIGNVIPWTNVDRLGNPLLKPEFTTTAEAGFELRFLNNRLGLEVTGYKANSKDLLIPVKISNTTGFDEAYINAGEIKNKGIEISLNAMPVRSNDFSWDFTINFSSNKNEVVKLNQGLNEILLESQFGYLSSNANMKLIPGYEYGALFGRTYKRYYGTKTEDPLRIDESAPLLIGANGFPQIDTKQKYLGSSQPDYIASTLQTFRYKQFAVSALLDTRQGQMKYNQFANFMAAFGVSKITENRTETIVFPGVLADGSPNTKPVYLGQATGPDGVNYGNGYYRNVYRGITENFVEDASWIRLRSLSLTYNLPGSILNRTKVLKGASVSLTGNNLWLKTDYTGFDPESSSFSSGANSSEGFSGFTYPGVRTFMASVNIQF